MAAPATIDSAATPLRQSSTAPVVFISYSHDGDEHREWVLRLASDLRAQGVNVVLDQWDLNAGQDIAAFMEQGVSRSDRVLIICTEAYVAKANSGTGGVGYEKLIITREVIATISTEKFIPVIRNNTTRDMPICLGPRKYVDFSDETAYQRSLEELLRAIHQAPLHAKPPIGPNPFASPAAMRRAETALRYVFDDIWFLRQRDDCSPKVHQYGPTTMELAFGLMRPSKEMPHKGLLAGVEQSRIGTFGWPIGAVLSRPDAKPRPTAEGILAEIEHQGFSDKPLMDIWALRKNGDFYLLHNVFEDQRNPHAIYFNTRIVRVAESVLFARNLYSNLGFDLSDGFRIRVRHSGLKGRELRSSNPNRIVEQAYPATEDSIETVADFRGVPNDDDVVALTEQLVAPVLMLFDFFEIKTSVYREIVQDFIAGRVT